MSVSVASVVVPVSAVIEVFTLKRPSGNILLYSLLFAQAILWVVYGCVTNRQPIVYVNALYSVVTGVYMLGYACYAVDRRGILISCVLGLSIFILCCVLLPDKDIQTFILGSTATVCSSLLSFVPLREVADVLRKKSVSADFPIGLALTGLLGSCMWGICAVFMRSLPYLVSNIISLALCGLQVAVYMVFQEQDVPQSLGHEKAGHKRN
jgi:hypothetical protein